MGWINLISMQSIRHSRRQKFWLRVCDRMNGLLGTRWRGSWRGPGLAVDLTTSSEEWIRTERLKEVRIRIVREQEELMKTSHLSKVLCSATKMNLVHLGDCSAHWTGCRCEKRLGFEEFRRKTQMLSKSNHQQRREWKKLLDRCPPHVRRVWFMDEKCFTGENPLLPKMTKSIREKSRQKDLFVSSRNLRVKSWCQFRNGENWNCFHRRRCERDFCQTSEECEVVIPIIWFSLTHLQIHEYLDRLVPEYIEQELWLANIPDLNPVDYRI